VQPPTSTNTPAPAAGQLSASASVSNPTPKPNDSVTVTGQLVDSAGKGASGATMSTTWAYKTTKSACDGATTGADGSSSCSLKVSRATPGFTVKIDVVFSLNGKSYSASTSFTPQ